MHDEQNRHDLALTELRRKLTDGLALARLNQTQLAARADLGRTAGARSDPAGPGRMNLQARSAGAAGVRAS